MTAIPSPLKYHGGKHYLAEKIVALMPPHVHYVEPFAGGLSVLLAKEPEGVSEVVNDLNGQLTNFWKVLQNPACFEKFSRSVECLPFSEEEWRRSGEINFQYWSIPMVDAGVKFFVRCRQSLAGRMNGFATLSRRRTRRGMNEQASAWLSTVEGLPAVHARLKRVVILNHDALKVIREQDGKDTLFYLDPPYLHETRATTGEYAHEMTGADHAALLNLLSVIEGKFILSGYPSMLYDEAGRQFKWQRREFELPNNAAGGTEKRRMVECVWTNYEPPHGD